MSASECAVAGSIQSHSLEEGSTQCTDATTEAPTGPGPHLLLCAWEGAAL